MFSVVEIDGFAAHGRCEFVLSVGQGGHGVCHVVPFFLWQGLWLSVSDFC